MISDQIDSATLPQPRFALPSWHDKCRKETFSLQRANNVPAKWSERPCNL